MTGKLIIFSAPSGSGKSTIINYLLTQNLNLAFSISATSRPPRGTEQHGVEYFFLTPEEFRCRIENNEFLEYEEVYKDRYYGTLKAQVEKQLEAGQNVVFDVDVVVAVTMGAKQETLNGLTGIGDLIVTCESKHSRNRKAGMLIGQGYTMQQAMDEVKMVVEGVYSAKAAIALAKKYGVDMPIIEEVNKVLFEDKPAKEAVNDLMLRDKKMEHGNLGWED